MKIRNGFVSNSSSSSFILYKEGLSDEQKNMIMTHIDSAIKLAEDMGLSLNQYGRYDLFGCVGKYDNWEIKEYNSLYFIETSMNNFDFFAFLKYINVSEKNISHVDDWYQIQDLEKMDKELTLENREKKLKRIL